MRIHLFLLSSLIMVLLTVLLRTLNNQAYILQLYLLFGYLLVLALTLIYYRKPSYFAGLVLLFASILGNVVWLLTLGNSLYLLFILAALCAFGFLRALVSFSN